MNLKIFVVNKVVNSYYIFFRCKLLTEENIMVNNKILKEL